ncbi:hydrolase, haloacid dehalogenase-like family protein [Carnobacterium sp. AT7]|uniref:sugar-phosphatase n=1 Tax=Carnobacterium TaxID=2747 RepID=UPI00015F2B3E|nr:MULTISPECIES: sugar-phosphatase [Carnobacterium]EDP67955.1 hydrolase, haloacid dehalogenase-like family protein [Carnobacterium sp. AT7]
MIKLVAIDLDGTLLNREHIISDENKEVIKKAKEQGVKVVLCTGRPLLGMISYLEELNLREVGDYGITYNGGLVQRTDTGEVLSKKTLTKVEIEEIFALSKEINVPCNFIDLEKIYEPPYPEGRDSLYPTVMRALPYVPIEMEHVSEDIAINKTVFCYEQTSLDEAIKKIPVHFHEKYTIMKSRPVLLELMPKGVDKGSGIAVLADLLGFEASEVMSLGDEANDAAMIEYAGMGVAMGNATDEIKAMAQYITKTNEEHGVAHAIQKFVLN